MKGWNQKRLMFLLSGKACLTDLPMCKPCCGKCNRLKDCYSQPAPHSCLRKYIGQAPYLCPILRRFLDEEGET